MGGVVGTLQMLLQGLSITFKLQETSLVISFCKGLLESKKPKQALMMISLVPPLESKLTPTSLISKSRFSKTQTLKTTQHKINSP